MLYKKKFLILFIAIVTFILISQTTLATACPKGEVDCSGTCQPADTAPCLPNPLGNNVQDPQTLIGKVIIAALGIVGSIALLMFIYGGFVWMTAAGNQEMVTRGRNILIWAAIGLIVIFSSYALVKFVFQGVGAPIT